MFHSGLVFRNNRYRCAPIRQNGQPFREENAGQMITEKFVGVYHGLFRGVNAFVLQGGLGVRKQHATLSLFSWLGSSILARHIEAGNPQGRSAKLAVECEVTANAVHI